MNWIDDPRGIELGDACPLPEGVEICRTCGSDDVDERTRPWCWSCYRDGSTAGSDWGDE